MKDKTRVKIAGSTLLPSGRIPSPIRWMGLFFGCVFVCACSDPANTGSHHDGWVIGSEADGGDVDTSSSDGAIGAEVICGEYSDSLHYGWEWLEQPVPLDEDCDVFLGWIHWDGRRESDVSVLPSLRVIEGGLRVTGGYNLQSLHGLERLERVGGALTFRSNSPLHNLEGLSNLRRVDHTLYIHRNTELTTLRGLESLTSVGELDIDNNDSLQSLEGLEGLEELENADAKLLIYNNDRLEDLSALSNLRQVNFALGIRYNNALRELHGLENVRHVGQLAIVDNPALESLDGLSGLEQVHGDVRIWGNEALSQQQIEAFLDRLEVGGEIVLIPDE